MRIYRPALPQCCIPNSKHLSAIVRFCSLLAPPHWPPVPPAEELEIETNPQRSACPSLTLPTTLSPLLMKTVDSSPSWLRHFTSEASFFGVCPKCCSAHSAREATCNLYSVATGEALCSVCAQGHDGTLLQVGLLARGEGRRRSSGTGKSVQLLMGFSAGCLGSHCGEAVAGMPSNDRRALLTCLLLPGSCGGRLGLGRESVQCCHPSVWGVQGHLGAAAGRLLVALAQAWGKVPMLLL